MKRTLLLIVPFLFVLSLCACGSTKEEIKEPVNFYYLKTENFIKLVFILTPQIRMVNFLLRRKRICINLTVIAC